MSFLVLTLTVLLTGGVVKDDFLVNPDSPDKCTKGNATIAPSPQGWFVVWEDTRNARESNRDLFGQYLSTSLVPSGINLMVTSDSMHPGQEIVCAASDSAGNMVVLWRAGGAAGEYWLRRVSPSGVPTGKDTMLFAVGSDKEATMAMNSSGEYVILWQDAGYVGLLKFNEDGTANGEVQHVIEGSGLNLRVAIASNGAVIAAWSTEISDTVMVCARTYRPSGTPRGDWFKVAGYVNPISTPQMVSVDVGSDHAGKFILSWVLWDPISLNPYALYSRSYSWDGSATGPAKIIYKMNSAVTSITAHKMVVGWDGSFTVAWSDARTGVHRVYLQNFNADGSLRGPELTVSEESPEDNCILRALALNADQWMAVYSRQRGGLYEMLGRRGMVYGSMLGAEVAINDDESSINEVYPQVLADDEGNFTVLWCEDWSKGPAWFARFTKDGEPKAGAQAITDSSGINRLYPNYSALASINRKSGEFVIAWERSNPPEFRCQRYTSAGYPSGNVKVIGELDKKYAGSFFGVSMNRKGAYAAVWADQSTLFVKRFDKYDAAIDASPIVVKTNIQYVSPAVSLADGGGFIVAWKEKKGLIDVQRFNSSGKPLGEALKVNDLATWDKKTLAMAADDEGNFCVVWPDSVTGCVFAQFFDASGSRLGSNKNTGLFLLDSSQATNHDAVNVAALPGDGFVVYGTDYSELGNDPEVSAIYYHSDGTPWSRKVQVNDPDLFCFNYQAANYNSVAAGGNRIVYVWQDNRRHKGWDVYAKVVDLEVPGVVEPVTPPPPLDFEAVTTVGATVTLRYTNCPGGFHASVFDASGRRVGEIRSAATTGTAVWGESFGPGVYFIMPDDLKMTPAKIVLVK